MTVAASIPLLKNRIYRYLREPGSPHKALREFLNFELKEFDRIAIVGGLVRDLARRGKVGFKSDIDIVIDSDVDKVAELARVLDAKPNRFGGFGWKSDRWKIDFWALRATWASTNGHVLVTKLSDIPKTTFFDCDAVCYDYRAKTVYASPEYLPRLRARTIDINLLPNPSVEGNLLRAARRILLWGFRPGETLRSFIDDHLDEASFQSIADTEANLFQNPVTQGFGGAAELRAALLADRLTSLLNTAANEQLILPGIRDLPTSQSK
jgi:predicted nucleotidyltransferase